MGIIRTLPPAVVNQIAAGEVVERPASVVKELMENAIDSGATRIELTVERGGKDLVRVADNGKGMAPEDLPLAFLPHATSKIHNAEDLFGIRTLGFRGEALAAIAEVSKVRCQSRPADQANGAEILVEAGQAGSVRECGCPQGTVIEVRHLFQNTPVRRGFLKSDSTEAGHVAETFTRVALAHADLHLTYRSAGKVLHDLPTGGGLKSRIAHFFGRELADQLIWVEGSLEDVKLWGYVGHPSQSRANGRGQYFFLGGRAIRDRALSHALTEAYRGLLMVGRSPVAFLFLELPADSVDVNVHPSKIEVRFRDGPFVYSHLLSTLRRTFLKSDLTSRLHSPANPSPPRETETEAGAGAGAEAEAEPDSPRWAESGETRRDDESYRLAGSPARKHEVDSWFSGPSRFDAAPRSWPPAGGRPIPDASEFVQFHPTPHFGSGELPPPAGPVEQFDEFSTMQASPAYPNPNGNRSVNEGLEVTESVERGGRPAIPELPARAIQVHDSYLVAETPEGMVVIDQHALHERILFEEFKARIARGSLESQRLLIPEPVDLSPGDAGELVQNAELLGRLGLGVEASGDDAVVVTSMPVMLAQVSPEGLARDLVDHLRATDRAPSLDAVLNDLLSMMACKAAVKAGQRLAPEEIDALLKRRHLVTESHHCPHGRPTVLVFTKTELERQFGRI